MVIEFFFTTKSQRKNVAGPGLEPATPKFVVRLAPDCARRLGFIDMCEMSVNKSLSSSYSQRPIIVE